VLNSNAVAMGNDQPQLLAFQGHNPCYGFASQVRAKLERATGLPVVTTARRVAYLSWDGSRVVGIGDGKPKTILLSFENEPEESDTDGLSNSATITGRILG